MPRLSSFSSLVNPLLAGIKEEKLERRGIQFLKIVCGHLFTPLCPPTPPNKMMLVYLFSVPAHGFAWLRDQISESKYQSFIHRILFLALSAFSFMPQSVSAVFHK